MRLIDADGLKPTKGMFIYQTEDADVIATEAYRWELIEKEAPTVEAIPIEFIKQLIEKFDCERGNAIKDTFAHILTGLLEFWEFEQEKENE